MADAGRAVNQAQSTIPFIIAPTYYNRFYKPLPVNKLRQHSPKPELGWKEWVALPELGIPLIKAKVDTGARTAALDTISLQEFAQDGIAMARFEVRVKNQKHVAATKLTCTARVMDSRMVTNSGGVAERRVVITTGLLIGNKIRQVEITLTNRNSMKFRILLGRTSIGKDFVVNPGKSYLRGKPQINDTIGN